MAVAKRELAVAVVVEVGNLAKVDRNLVRAVRSGCQRVPVVLRVGEMDRVSPEGLGLGQKWVVGVLSRWGGWRWLGLI